MGAESLPASWCLNDLGYFHSALGEYDRALECLQRATKVKEKLLPPGQPDIAISRMQVANCLVRLGRCDEARPILEDALRTYRRTLGPDHEVTAWPLSMLADQQRCLGDYEESRKSACQGAAICRAKWGADSMAYAGAQIDLALLALETGRESEADSLTRASFAVYEKAGDPVGPLMIATCLEMRAVSLRRIGREAEATALLDSTRAIRQRVRNHLHGCPGEG